MRSLIGGFRRVAGIGIVGVAVVTAALAVPAANGVASATPVTGSNPNGTYLALGDSVAFGYAPPQAVPAPNYANAGSFVGYPEDVAELLGERVSNASCPGETSTSM